MRASRFVAVAAVLASAPLFSIYALKYASFSPGYFFVALYSASLISLPATVVLLLVEAILIVVSSRRGEREVRNWHLGGAAVCVLALLNVLIVRNL